MVHELREEIEKLNFSQDQFYTKASQLKVNSAVLPLPQGFPLSNGQLQFT